MRTQTTRTIAGRVNADGSIAQTTGGFSVQKGSTGVWTIRFDPGVRLLSASATNATGEGFVVTITNFTPTSFQPVCYLASTGVATDKSFLFVAVALA